MKVLFSICLLITITLLLSFYKPTSKGPGHSFKRQPPATMLDSLQGTWISTMDSSWQITISGRVVDDVYKEDHAQHEYFKLYFSDTLVDGENLTIGQARINASSTSGKYLVEVAGETIWCYEIIGLYFDGTQTTFAYQATWTDEGPNNFAKQ